MPVTNIERACAVTVTTGEWARTIGARPIHIPVQEGLVQRFFRNHVTGARVHMIALEGFGHDWPNTQNSEFSAVDWVVDFFGLTTPPSGGPVN